MKVILTKGNLLDMIAGTSVPMGGLKLISDKGYGSWTGGHKDTWSWHRYAMKDLPMKELVRIYNLHQENEENKLKEE